MESKLSHFNEEGKATMVDVGEKNPTRRIAITRCLMCISPLLTRCLKEGKLEKGDAFTIAKTAGILAAKNTGQLIPMCHPLPIEWVDIRIDLQEEQNEIWLQAEVHTSAKTGVEMESLVAVNIAALTIYDMCKAVDKKIRLEKVGLWKKTGGKSGTFINLEMEWPRK